MKKQFFAFILSAITYIGSSALAMDEPPPDTFIITTKEAGIINDHLVKGERVIIHARGIKAGEITYKDKDTSQSLTTRKIAFVNDVRISWEGDGILEVEAQDNIVFEDGAVIKNKGKGGLRLVSKGGCIKFQGLSPQIDFRESEGAICILHKIPEVQQENAFNPHDYEKHIQKNSRVLYSSFNCIPDAKDIRLIYNSDSHYCFSSDIYYKDKSFFIDMKAFQGIFNFNGRSLSLSCNRGYREPVPTCPASFLFKKCLPENWGEQVIFMAPPLEDTQNNLLTYLEKGENFKAIKCIGEIFIGELVKWQAGRLAFYNGAEKNTPLHIAAKMGRVEPLKFMLLHIFKPFSADLRSDQPTFKYLMRNPFSLLGRKNAEGFKPIDLAVQHGHIDIVNEIMSCYTRYNVPQLLGKERLLNLIIEQEKRTLSMKSFLENFEDPPFLFGKLVQGFPIKDEALQKEYKRQQQVERRFFLHCKEPKDLRQPGTARTRWIFDDFKDKYNARQSLPSYNLEGVPSRSRIILLQAITNHKLSTITDIKTCQCNKTYWNKEPKEHYTQLVDNFPITYQWGGKIHKVKNMPTERKPGFAYYQEIGDYESICQQVPEIEKRLPAQKIAKLLKGARVTGKSITAQILQEKGYSRERNVEGKFSAEADASYLNCLHFLLDLEVASRFVNNSKSSYDKLPIGSANTRAFSLQRRKQLSFDQLLSKQSSYHPFTDRDESKTPITRENAIKKINKKFQKNWNSHDKSLTAEIAEWQALHPGGYIIKTPEGLHQELLEEYGGDYESSGEEYSL